MKGIDLAFVGFDPLVPVVSVLQTGISLIDGVVHGYGWTMVVLAIVVKVVFWPLNAHGAKSTLRMQALAPRLKALQSTFKDRPHELNAATMALYEAEGVNPLAGCVPQLVQLPILIGLYWAVVGDRALFASQSWLWIGSAAAARVPGHLLAASLAAPDIVLLGLYVVSMYFSMMSTSAPTDSHAPNHQRIAAFASPVITGYLGLRYAWPSAILIYWLTANLIAIAQQRATAAKFAANVTTGSKTRAQFPSVAAAYLSFLSGREYRNAVDVVRARWVARTLTAAFVFAFALLYGAATAGSAPASATELLAFGFVAVTVYAAIAWPFQRLAGGV